MTNSIVFSQCDWPIPFQSRQSMLPQFTGCARKRENGDQNIRKKVRKLSNYWLQIKFHVGVRGCMTKCDVISKGKHISICLHAIANLPDWRLAQNIHQQLITHKWQYDRVGRLYLRDDCVLVYVTFGCSDRSSWLLHFAQICNDLNCRSFGLVKKPNYKIPMKDFPNHEKDLLFILHKCL